MSDLMTRLQEEIGLYGLECSQTPHDLAPRTTLTDALKAVEAEIERLRAALGELAGPTWSGCGRGEAEIREWVRDIARRALNPEAEHE